MTLAITTRYFGPTDFKGSRIIAKTQHHRLIMNYDYEGNEHARAAEKLARKLRWAGTWAEGSLPDGRGNCYVRVPTHREFAAFTIEEEAA